MLPNLEQNSNRISRIFFSYLFSWLISAPKKGELTENDLMEPLDQLKAQNAYVQLNKNWKSAKETDQEKKTFFSIFWKTFGFRVASYGILLLTEELIHLIQPLCMGRVMNYFAPGSTMTKEDALLAAGGVAITSFLSPIIHHPYFYGVLKLGTEAKIGCSHMIFSKSLSLSASEMQKTTVGQIIVLLNSDVGKLDTSFMFMHYIWVSPIMLVLYIYIIYMFLGPSALAGFVCLFAVLFVQGSLGRKMGMCRREIARRADKRVAVMNEVLSGIRVIKMYNWEDAFSKIVDGLRSFEMSKLREMAIAQSTMMGMFFASGKLVVLIAVLTFVFLGNELTAERVFVTTALFNSCRLPFSLFLPFGIQLFFELRATCGRIQDFLTIGEAGNEEETSEEDCTAKKRKHKKSKKDQQNGLLDSKTLLKNDISSSTAEPQITINRSRTTDRARVELHDFSARWNDENLEADARAVRDINLAVSGDGLVGVVGPVGAGKSSLLLSILGETAAVSGRMDVFGTIAYCAQESWIFSGTIRENILFGMKFDEKKYKDVIDVCMLQLDFKELPTGDQTTVGDRGCTLSGGQRARVALARAVYSDADIYLLDDPLSAVDAAVGRAIYEKCIRGYLKNKARILVTHQIQFLNDVENVFLMKDSKVVDKGLMSDLRSRNPDEFKALIEAEKEKEEHAEETEPHRLRQLSYTSELSEKSCGGLPSPTSDKQLNIFDDESKEIEDRKRGTISFSVYLFYIRALFYNRFSSTILVFFVVFVQIVFNLVDWWLNKWINAAEYWNNRNATGVHSKGVYTQDYETLNAFGLFQFNINFNEYMMSYTAAVFIVSILTLIRCIWFRLVQVKVSRNLHNTMFDAVVNTYCSFFDENPIGRIINRFSADVTVMDEQLSFVFFEFVMGALNVVGTVAIILLFNPLVILPSTPIVLLFIALRHVYAFAARELKRLEATTRSPLYSHISASINGLSTIRAFGRQDQALEQFHEALDMNTGAFNMTMCAARWFAFYIDVLVAFFITTVVFVAISKHDSLSSSEVGLMLVYAVQLTGFFSWIVRQSTDLQNHMVSIERISEYSKLPDEHENEEGKKAEEDKLGLDWPSRGKIEFKNINVSYNEETVLKDVSFVIEPNQKIGIAGRTGAGKSTLLRVLFGLKHQSSGKIYIDDVDLDTVSLKFRRKILAIIPQEPVLFNGTIRRNLDPFDEYSDEIVWDALEQVQLKNVVTSLSGGLDASMQEGGTNFSVGQRQLVCLARALIHHAKILVIDEATANVDLKTDELIQNTIRTSFANSTVLTIAHRLNTIMECDKIMVYEKGSMVEYRTPIALMTDDKSLFRSLAVRTGSKNADYLTLVAAAHTAMKIDLTEANTQKEEALRNVLKAMDDEAVVGQEKDYSLRFALALRHVKREMADRLADSGLTEKEINKEVEKWMNDSPEGIFKINI